MIATCELVSTKFVYKSTICTKQFFCSPKFQDYSKQRTKNSETWIFKVFGCSKKWSKTCRNLKRKHDWSLLMSSNGVSLNNKKGLVIVSHVFKVKGIWQMNDIKLIQITWLLHVNWFLQNLFLNLQFAQNNSSIVQNSNTTTNKEKKNSKTWIFKVFGCSKKWSKTCRNLKC